MKRALELLDDLVTQVRPREGCAISLRETPAEDETRSNWIDGADPTLRPDELTRLVAASEQLHRKHPLIDWSGVPAVGQWRQVVRSADSRTELSTGTNSEGPTS
jgi:hypothetical protein